jgi:hypothetical protein
MYFDPLYFAFALPALILVFFAQWRVKSAYGKYSKVRNMMGIDGVAVAERLLGANNLSLGIERSEGDLSDHYDPRNRTLYLSPAVGRGVTVAAMAIVAHEVGHAVQDASGFALMKVRTAIVPVANLGSQLGYLLFVLGFIFQFTGLVWVGIVLFSAAVVFTLITLPVELDASRRAMIMLRSNGLVSTTEIDGAQAMLNAAALTYVAALAQAVSQLLYMFFRANSRRD